MTNFGSKTALGNPRIYNCKQCLRAFTREEHLTRHTLLTHNKLKPFACGICQRPFSRRDLLLRHAKNLHQGLELAVLRIRKLYPRDKRGAGPGLDDLELDLGLELAELLLPLAPLPLLMAMKVDSSSLGTKVTLPSPKQLAIPFPEDLEQKRLKMLVNMLVS
ncbi:C2H2-type zinc finger protein [Kocuria palustris]|nr:C2H2-type zinc finger protein [Kocuria palustris]